MKKRSTFLTKIISLVLVVVCSLGILSGCSLVKTDMEKDGNLKVATVQIENGINKTNIYKKDMYAAYVSYGYYYVNNYGYTLADTYQMILDNLIQNAVVVQYAKKELVRVYDEIVNSTDELTDFRQYFKENAKIANTTQTLTVNSDIDLFLTEYQIAESLYNVKKSITDLIDSFIETEEEVEEEKESVSLTARANPFEEEEEEELNEWELIDKVPSEEDIAICAKNLDVEVSEIPATVTDSMYNLNYYMYTTYNFDVSTKERQRAFNEAINGYRNLGIISKNEYHSSANALEYEYFKKQFYTEKSQQLVLFYQDSLEDLVKDELTYEMLYQDYKDLYVTQEAKFKNNHEAYEKALESATEDAPIVYHPFDGYGYVSNLLLGFSTEQTAELTSFKAQEGIKVQDTNDFRNKLVNALLVKDQRISWATEGYGMYDNDKYTFDDKYLLTSNTTLKDLLGSFIGKVENPTSSTEDDENGLEKTTWKVTNGIATAISYKDFYDTYLSGCLGFASDIASVTFNPSNDSGVATLTNYDDDSMRDLIYAFSTDPGSLSSKNGYIYSPITSATTYVPEFAAAAKAIVKAGEGAYTLVVTDYGVHVMVCLDKIAPSTEMIGDDFINYLSGKANNLTQEQKDFIDNFKKVKQDSLVSSYVSEKANSFVKQYLDKEDKKNYAAVLEEDNYSDLIN